MSDDPAKDEHDANFKTGFPPLDLDSMKAPQMASLLRQMAGEVISLGHCAYISDDEAPTCSEAGEEEEWACLYCQAQRIMGQ